MSLGKQAKVLTKQQIDLLYTSLSLTQDEDRNRLIFLLSIRAGLRAKEIADLKWSMVMDADGCVCDQISLDNTASKGNSGRAIPLNKQLRVELVNHLTKASMKSKVGDLHNERVIRTQRGKATSAQVIVICSKVGIPGQDFSGVLLIADAEPSSPMLPARFPRLAVH